MGVDFKICKQCDNTFPDCGPYAYCKHDWGGCGAVYCDDECGQRQLNGNPKIPHWRDVEALPPEEFKALAMTCVDCRGELASDDNLLDYVLSRVGWTRPQVIAAYLAKETGPLPSGGKGERSDGA